MFRPAWVPYMIFIRTGRDKHFRDDRWDEEIYLDEKAMDWLLTFDPIIVGTDEACLEVPDTENAEHEHSEKHSKPKKEHKPKESKKEKEEER